MAGGKTHLWQSALQIEQILRNNPMKAAFVMSFSWLTFWSRCWKVFATLGGGGSLTLWKYKYPAQRVSKQEDGSEVGVAGTMEKLQESQIADQPISGTGLLQMRSLKLFYSAISTLFLITKLSKMCTLKFFGKKCTVAGWALVTLATFYLEEK